MKIKQFKKTICYKFDKSEKDQNQVWALLNYLNPLSTGIENKIKQKEILKCRGKNL